MALAAIKHVKKISIVPNVAATTATTIAGMAANQVAICDTAGNILDTTTVTAVDVIRIVKTGSAGQPLNILSFELDKRGLQVATAKGFIASTLTVGTIGYDGTSGAIDVVSDNEYVVTTIDRDSPSYGTTGYRRIGYFASNSSATEKEIADGLVLNLAANSETLIAQPYKAELLLSVTRSASGGSAASYSFINGSRSVTFTGTTNFVAGDYIALAATVTTAVCYKIQSAVAGVLTLEIPFQGTTVTVATGAIRISSTAAATSNFGIKLTGLPQPFPSVNTAAAQEFYVARFQVATQGFGATPVVVVEGNKGSGASAEIAVIERSLVGEQGFLYTATWPPAQFPNETNINALGYGVIYLAAVSGSGPMVLQGDAPANRKELVIACEVASVGPVIYGTVVSDATVGLIPVLSAWASTTLSF
jgi:hypothetical protein